MSITYQLYLSQSELPEQVLQKLGERLGIPTAPIQLEQAVSTETIPHLALSVYAVQAPMNQFIREDFGIEPSVCLNMALDKNELGLAQTQLVDVLRAVMANSPEDLLLLREGETVAYRRQGGTATLGAQDPLWHEPARRQRFEQV